MLISQLSTLHRLFTSPTMIITYFVPCREGGTPTDIPIIKALNGWIKEELFLDFGLAEAGDVPALLDRYVHFFNYHPPAAALGYKSPVQYKTEQGYDFAFLVSTFP